MSTPTRLPINRQAALAVRQKRCWLEEPPPEKPKTVSIEEHTRALAQLKIERNNLARITDELGVSRASVKALKMRIERLLDEIRILRQECRDYKETIRQLEDIKL